MSGYFEAWANQIRWSIGPAERDLMRRVTEVVQRDLRGNVYWAGSQAKGTAIMGSDLDMCIQTPEPVTEAQRRLLAGGLRAALGRPAEPKLHVVRMAAHGSAPRVDIAFAHAAFGSRPLPDVSEFKGRNARQQAARALKFWARGGGLPPVGGWALEKVVVHLDAREHAHGLGLVVDAVDWLADRANPAAIEALLRPVATPRWQPIWSEKLPGRLEALKNAARALRSRYRPDGWRSIGDVERWVRGQSGAR
ncbi:MAG: nucleotidyltransferase domain-containing protein [Myxococcales bacterium]|nr:nucleotidyltransferase domain-containing protein [Myxococcales bacterium]